MPSPESVRQTLSWVLLPNGLTEDRANVRLSVYMTPSLMTDGFDDTFGPPTLADYPDFLDWPRRLEEATFVVSLPDGTNIPARPHIEASLELWQQLFPPSTLVIPFGGNDMTSHPVATYSAGEVTDTLTQSYADTTMLAIDDLPTLGGWDSEGFLAPQPEQPFAELINVFRNRANDFLHGTGEEFTRGFQDMVGLANSNMGLRAGPEEMVELRPNVGDPGDELARALLFNRGLAVPMDAILADEAVVAQEAVVARSPEPDPADVQRLRDSFDFHKIVAALGEHPVLLRRLGFAFDLTIPVSALPGGGATSAASHMRLFPTWPSQLTDENGLGEIGPDGEFRPFSNTTNVSPATEHEYDPDPEAPMPFRATSRLADAVPGLLHLGLGPYRVDQVDVDGALQKAAAMALSIQADATQTAPPALRTGGLTLVEQDKASQMYGDMASSAGQIAGMDPSTHLFAEDLTRGYRLDVFDDERGAWFSLHARRVRYERDGQPVVQQVQGEGMFHVGVTGAPTTPGAELTPGTPLYMHEGFVRWDGWSLSAPRPGRSLSVHPNASDPERPETEPQRIANDPLTSTGLQIESEVTPGTLPRLRFGRRYRMRIRTVDLVGNGLDLDAADHVLANPPPHESTEEGPPPPPITEPVEFLRHEPVSPPVFLKQRTGLPGEAQHRLVVRSAFDPEVGARLGANPARDERFLAAPKGSVELAERHGGFDQAIGSRDPGAHQISYDVAAQESGVVPDGPVTDIPYLPDPLSAGIAVVGLPGMPVDDVFYARWEAETWDNPKPITFRLVTHAELFDPGPQWDPATRMVTVFLAGARQRTVRVSSMLPPPPAKPPLGLLALCRQHLDADAYRQLEATVLASRHCMFTPWQDVELVHAVQRPLKAPDLEFAPDGGGGLEFRREGETDYSFTGNTIVDAYGTGSLDLVARWQEWHDDPTVPRHSVGGAPIQWHKDMSVEVGTLPVERPATDDELAPRVRFYDEGSPLAPLQFSDTKFRRITFQARAITRFAEYFPPELAEQPGSLSVDGEPLTLLLPSTQRPPVPVILDVVPTSGSAIDPSDPTVRRREGGWVRIYVARPWYVTGEGEQLAVVVSSQTPTSPTDRHYEHTSLLGADPAHFVPPPTGMQTAFLEGAASGFTNVHVPEALTGGLTLFDYPDCTLLGYDPQFDEANQRWYFDVRVNVPNSYFPMVRLAVVRYQRVSIDIDPIDVPTVEYHHFSPVVLLDPVPLFPDRELQVEETPFGELQIKLSGTTYEHVIGFAGPEEFQDDRLEALARVTVRYQRHRGLSLTGDPDDDWETVARFPMVRNVPAGFWAGSLPVDRSRVLEPGTERLLVVEEDRVPTDPAGGLRPGFTNRTIYAEAVGLTHPIPESAFR